MPGYVELHAHSNFSLLDGASHPEELVARAAALDMPALALTDHDAVYGAPRFMRAAREQGVQPILGAELTLTTGHHLTLLVENQAGWHNLCYLISRARHEAAKGEAILPPEELVGCTGGLIALSGCRRSEIATALLNNNWRQAVVAAQRYRDLFGRDNFAIELQRHFIPGEEVLVARLAAVANYLGLDCVATNNIHYATPDRQRLQDVLVCIRHLTTLDQSAHLRRLNSEYYLKPAAQMAALFPDHPEALANTLRLAERCHFELDYGLQDLPHFATPGGMSSSAYLRRLCEEALQQRFAHPPANVRRQLGYELEVVERAGLANYFLIVWDIVGYARRQGIRCQGRGSAANSLVAYLLYISPVNPLEHDLVFERFLSFENKVTQRPTEESQRLTERFGRLSGRMKDFHSLWFTPLMGNSYERQVIPDIDIDFEARRREEVIQYVYEQYGAEHTAMACTFVTFRRRSALRDIGRALDLSAEVLEAAERAVETVEVEQAHRKINHRLHRLHRLGGGKVLSAVELLVELSREIEGFPRHLGIHAGGMVVTGSPLMGRAPTEPATMPGRVVSQWDKEGLEDVGLVKIDLLGLRMLSAIGEAVALIEAASGATPDLDTLTFDDPAVYEMIGQADTIGVFQVESRAQAQMLPRLRPRCFADLVVAISLIRPGPVQGNMVHPYLRRRAGLEPVVYLHPLLEPALAETLGIILFQEQVLKVARDLAGFTAGQGEQLRRALGAKRAEEEIEKFRAAFVAGATGRDVPAEVAATVFDQLRAFGGYSFAKSHAAAFAVLVYQSAWLKRYHFAAFYAALLNNQPMGFWNPAVLVNEARRKGVLVLPADIHHSQARCTVEDGAIRLGLNYVKALGEEPLDRIISEREKRPFASLGDFCRRTRLGRRPVENLILAGAMDEWNSPRRQLLWELGTLHYQEDELELAFPSEPAPLPELSAAEAMLAEQSVLGLSTGDHVMTFYRDWLDRQGVLGSRALADCADGQRVRVAGLVVVHQSPPTAKGHHFLTLEDEDGMINVIVRPRVFDRHRQTIRTARLLLVEGTVQRQDEVISFLAGRITSL